MSFALGIDTSNYTTSAALFNESDGQIISVKRLLEVKTGDIGLRQSDAVFQHIKALPEILKETLKSLQGDLSAIGVSATPRDVEGSYMPCFLSGVSVASGIADAMKIPLFKVSHQRGHILAALYSANKLELLGKKFIAFHISGGTTEALLCEPDDDLVIKCTKIAGTNDLNAGQVVDRVGNLLGFGFPAGHELDNLSLKGDLPKKTRPVIKDDITCCLSGVENICEKLKNDGEVYENIARYAIEFISDTLEKMTDMILSRYGNLPLIFAGGVMSNSFIRKKFTEKYNAFFAEPRFSSDNAVGVAILAHLKNKK